MKHKWKPNDSVETNAAKQLPALALQYFEAGSHVLKTAAPPDELHQFRLLTKHFRYTLELFEKQYGRAFGALLKKLKPVQDALGEINDAATALSWLKEQESPPSRHFLADRIQQKIAAFQKYWKTTFDREGQRGHWAAVLSSPRKTAEGEKEARATARGSRTTIG